MSMSTHQQVDQENLIADFEDALSRRDFDAALSLKDEMGERGFELEALKMHRAVNRAQCQQTCKDMPGFGHHHIDCPLFRDYSSAEESHD
jgi:hypothetical protein